MKKRFLCLLVMAGSLAVAQQAPLTTNGGAPVGGNQNSQTAGETGPVLLQDIHLIAKLASFDRERIPERDVHARGAGAYGEFVSSGDQFRDPRGFATKFSTTEGNYDLVGNHLPVLSVRHAMKFPDMVHALKLSPVDNKQHPNRFFDFFSQVPEATHMLTHLYSGHGTPTATAPRACRCKAPPCRPPSASRTTSRRPVSCTALSASLSRRTSSATSPAIWPPSKIRPFSSKWSVTSSGPMPAMANVWPRLSASPFNSSGNPPSATKEPRS